MAFIRIRFRIVGKRRRPSMIFPTLSKCMILLLLNLTEEIIDQFNPSGLSI